MDRRSLLSLFLVLGVFFGCEDAIDQKQEPLTYQGKVVLETTPSFIFSGKGVAAKGVAPNAELEISPPYGTVYGHASQPENVFLAQGGELLPNGSWVDQVFHDVYVTTLFSNGVISFDDPTTIVITGAAQCKYLNEDGQWVPIHGAATVTAKGVATGPNGTTTIETTSRINMGHGGTNG